MQPNRPEDDTHNLNLLTLDQAEKLSSQWQQIDSNFVIIPASMERQLLARDVVEIDDGLDMPRHDIRVIDTNPEVLKLLVETDARETLNDNTNTNTHTIRVWENIVGLYNAIQTFPDECKKQQYIDYLWGIYNSSMINIVPVSEAELKYIMDLAYDRHPFYYPLENRTNGVTLSLIEN